MFINAMISVLKSS